MSKSLIDQFAADWQVRLAALLIGLDFILGVSESIVNKHFRLAFLADFLRNDILGKMVPFYAVWWATTLAGDIELGAVDAIKDSVWAVLLAAMSGSILNSLTKLRLRDPAVKQDPIIGDERPPAP